MGNRTSSCLISHSSSSTAKLFDACGNLRRVQAPVKAAEIMLEEPGHAVSSVDELRKTRRVVAMRADDELLAGKVYLLVPLKRINCKVSELEMAIVESACCKKKIRSIGRRSSSKVLPAAATDRDQIQIQEDDENSGGRSDFGVLVGGGDNRNMMIQSKWNPVLEPITEWSRECSFTS